MSNKERRDFFLSTYLIENRNGQLKHCLSKKGWLTGLREYVLTLNMNGLFLWSRFLYFSSGSREAVGRKGCWFLSSPQHLKQNSPATWCIGHKTTAVTTRMETEMFPKQQTVTVFNLYATVPKGPMGQDVPSTYLSKLGLIVNSALFPGGKDSPPVLHLCHLPLSEQEWPEEEALAGLGLLPII